MLATNDIVLLQFPFSDLSGQQKRPALMLAVGTDVPTLE